MFALYAVGAHTDIVDAARFLQRGQRVDKIGRFGSVCFPKGARHAHQAFVTAAAFRPMAVIGAAHGNKRRTVFKLRMEGAERMCKAVLGGASRG